MGILPFIILIKYHFIIRLKVKNNIFKKKILTIKIKVFKLKKNKKK